MDWRPSGGSPSGSGNTLAESIFKQMADEDYSMPEWVVCALGETGEAAWHWLMCLCVVACVCMYVLGIGPCVCMAACVLEEIDEYLAFVCV